MTNDPIASTEPTHCLLREKDNAQPHTTTSTMNCTISTATARTTNSQEYNQETVDTNTNKTTNDTNTNTNTNTNNNTVVVIKFGSSSLCAEAELDHAYLRGIAVQLKQLIDLGYRPLIVSSGAVAAGMLLQEFDTKPSGCHARQGLAAIGQVQLMSAWEHALRGVGIRVGQLLVTREDFSNELRSANFIQTINTLLDWGVVPVLNENDSLTTDAITVDDNDQLSAIVAAHVHALVLLLLTDVAGVYEADPRVHPNAQVVPIMTSTLPDGTLTNHCGEPGARGRGGMRSKIVAARLAAASGINTVIAHARERDVLLRIVKERCEGKAKDVEVVGAAARMPTNRIGTLFPSAGTRHHAAGSTISRRVQGVARLASEVEQTGQLQPVLQQRANILGSMIATVEGNFDVGDVLSVVTADGRKELARGRSAVASTSPIFSSLFCCEHEEQAGKATTRQLRRDAGGETVVLIDGRDLIVLD